MPESVESRRDDDTFKTGYASFEYAASFSGAGSVVEPAGSPLPFVRRPLPGERYDLSGLYPFSVCRDWRGLKAALQPLGSTPCVSVVLVTDPFAENFDRRAGWTCCRSFKRHWVVDLTRDWRSQRSRKTRYYTRKALSGHLIDVVRPSEHDALSFSRLYRETLSKHDVQGIQKFPSTAISTQLQAPGAWLVSASRSGIPMGMAIIYHQREFGYLHLGGFAPQATRLSTSYGIMHSSLVFLESRGCKFVTLGGNAGQDDDEADGLSRFKRRWANDQRVTYLVGEILDKEAHSALALGAPETNFFPAYRAPGGPLAWKPWSDDSEVASGSSGALHDG